MNIFGTPIHIGLIEETPDFKATFDSFDPTKHAKPAGIHNPTWLCDVNTTHGDGSSADSPWVRPFIDMIMPSIVEYVSQIKVTAGFSIQARMPWVNVYNKGQYQDPHTHVFNGNVLSYCFFKHVPPHELFGGRFYFVNNNADKVAHGQEYELFVETAQRKYFPEVGNSSLVIFPAWLEHGVSVCTADGNRTTISGNIGFSRNKE